jgi:hypothetical protein
MMGWVPVYESVQFGTDAPLQSYLDWCPMAVPLRATLYSSVTNARARLKAVEEEYENQLRDDPMTPHAAGQEYAARVQEYSNAVMAWRRWLDTHGKEGGG